MNRHTDRLRRASKTVRKWGGQARGGLRQVTYPDLSDWEHDPFARVALSILDKTPLSIAEVVRRASLAADELLDLLQEAAAEYGEDILAYPACSGTPVSICDAISLGENYSFSFLGVKKESSDRLREYAYRSLIGEVEERGSEQDEEVDAPGLS